MKNLSSKQAFVRYSIIIKGTVQGVGFRPFIHRTATSLSLGGIVSNTGFGLHVEVEGKQEKLDLFVVKLKKEHPPTAEIEEIILEALPPLGFPNFYIKHSQKDGKGTLIPPDNASCADCTAEINDPWSRYYLYPFTSCTYCGPRFTITRELPFDRSATSMVDFPLCPDCCKDYNNPLNRRFHAQATACPQCGPKVLLADKKGNPLSMETDGSWLPTAISLLQKGFILGIKGLGGFHLACHALNVRAIKRLRRLKGRKAQPFAVMARDMKAVKKYCLVQTLEEKTLLSSAAPVVILRRKEHSWLPEQLAPGLNSLGVMLPYTPLHKLLFSSTLDLLVMTSGNRHGLPIIKDNNRALHDLGKIVDFFIFHNREIVNHCDDSVVSALEDKSFFLRRSRGFVNLPLKVPYEKESFPILAVGGDGKNTFCLLEKGKAFISQHMGDLDTRESINNLHANINNLKKLTRINPSIVGHDLHPGYNSNREAGKIPGYQAAVQHHHAHLASCLAENNYTGKAIGVILDGSGYGSDGNLWGFEIMTGSFKDFHRFYHLAYIPLPGGERAILEPWKTAVAYLVSLGKEKGEKEALLFFPEKEQEISFMVKMMKNKINSPLSSSCGRLFDAASSLLGICQENTYEGQAAMEMSDKIETRYDFYLQELWDNQGQWIYPFHIQGSVIHPFPLLWEMVKDIKKGTAKDIIIVKFHLTVASMVLACIRLTANQTNLKTVALSGGCWQNSFLSLLVEKSLTRLGYKVLSHKLVPANDGGLSLGQALVCREKFSYTGG